MNFVIDSTIPLVRPAAAVVAAAARVRGPEGAARVSMSKPMCASEGGTSVGFDLADEHGGLFSERFVLRSRLGSGCSCSVYVVKDTTTGEEVACKLAQRRPSLRWSQLKVRHHCRPVVHTRRLRHSGPLACADPLRARGPAAAQVRAPAHHRLPGPLRGLRGPGDRARPDGRRRLPAAPQASRSPRRARRAHDHGAAVQRARVRARARRAASRRQAREHPGDHRHLAADQAVRLRPLVPGRERWRAGQLPRHGGLPGAGAVPRAGVVGRRRRLLGRRRHARAARQLPGPLVDGPA